MTAMLNAATLAIADNMVFESRWSSDFEVVLHHTYNQNVEVL